MPKITAPFLVSTSVAMLGYALVAAIIHHILQIKASHKHGERNRGLDQLALGRDPYYEHKRVVSGERISFLNRTAKQWQRDIMLALASSVAVGILALNYKKPMKH